MKFTSIHISTPAKLAWHEIRYGWRHFGVFLICLVMGMTALTAVGSLNKAIHEALSQQAHALLGGDIDISLSSNEATPEQVTFFKRYGHVSHVTTLRGMIWHNDQSVLVEIKAIDSSYPLVGELAFLPAAVSADTLLRSNSVAVDPELLEETGIQIGQTITLGKQNYTIYATIAKEPDRVVHLFSLGPRVMMSQQALSLSGLAGPYSLIRHHYRIAFDPNHTSAVFLNDLKKAYPTTPWQIERDVDGNPFINSFINQLSLFLELAALATLLIGGIGIGSNARSYLEQQAHTIAIYKTVGATRWVLLTLFTLIISVLTCIGSVIGIACAWGTILLCQPFLTAWIPALGNAPLFYPSSALLAFTYSLLIVYIFSLPPLLLALDIQPSLLFRNGRALLPLVFSKTIWSMEALLITLLIVILIYTSGDPDFICGAILVAMIGFAVFGISAYVFKLMARHLSSNRPWLQLALANLYRPGSTTTTVIFAIGISLSVFISLTLTEANFQYHITSVMEKQAPSLFFIDIQQDQRNPFYARLAKSASSDHIMMLPIIRGRIVKLNGNVVKPENVSDDVRWAIQGDRGFSYSTSLLPNSHISSGTWWPEDYKGKPLVSIDDRFLKGMNLTIGDTVTINILGQEITATIANARHIDYSTFQINFAMMFSPGVLEAFPATSIATVILDTKQNPSLETNLVRSLAHEFPNITSIRTSQAIERIKEIIHSIAMAMRVAIITSMIAGILVLSSCLRALLNQRIYDTAILKVVGASRRDILKTYLSEWILLGAVTTLIASIIGTLGAWLIMMRFPGQVFSIMPGLTLAVILAAMGLIIFIGYIGNSQVFRVKPASLLRNE
ncbi:MAG: ABC transporter permease [Alphaproteobacteria bacterium]|nr:ABC transporter permease [Alphaproteobacteria bacterium]